MNVLAEKLLAVIQRIRSLNEDIIEKRDGNQHTEFTKRAIAQEHFRHAVEEVGEMAQAIRGKNDEPLMNEAVDTAICALAIALLESHGDIDTVLDVFDAKVSKWEAAQYG